MAKLLRVLQKIFGRTGPVNEFGQIGSDANGASTTTKDIATIQALPQYEDGLFSIFPNADEPPIAEEINSMYYLFSRQLSYIFQDGISEWDSTTDYYVGSYVKVGSDIYVSLTGVDPTPNTGNNPISSPTNWRCERIASNIITSNTTLIGSINEIVNVQTGISDITITLPICTSNFVGIKKMIYNEDEDEGRVIITGDINSADDIYLRSKEVLILCASETDIGVYEWVIVKERDLSNQIYQDDSANSIVQPENTDLIELSSPTLAFSNGLLPEYIANMNFIPSDDSNAKYPKRGVWHNNNGVLVYSYSLQNEFFIYMRLKPNFSYNIASSQFLFDTRSLSGNDENSIVLQYEATIDSFRILISDTPSNGYRFDSDAFISDIDLQQWFDIIITGDTLVGANGDANVYINGDLIGTDSGTKVLNGTGISGADFTLRDKIAFNAYQNEKTYGSNYYLTDILFGQLFVSNTSNHDGSGSTKPYFSDNRISVKKRNISIDEYGNVGCNSISSLAINNGAGYEETIIVNIGPWNMDSTVQILVPTGITNLTLFDITYLEAFILADGALRVTINKITGVSSTGQLYGSILFRPSTGNIEIIRATGGFYDGPAYDDTTVTRGYVIMKYIRR